MKRITSIIMMIAIVISTKAQKIIFQKNNGTIDTYSFYQSSDKVTFDRSMYYVYINNDLHSYSTSEVTYIYFMCQDNTTGTLNGHDWVDLGLPSGTKWATCNVGATSETEYGEYYAWGETTTRDKFGVDYYDYYGSYTISSNIALSDCDVATKRWGRPWRMPSYKEVCELVNNCEFKWTTVKNINGATFIGPNGNSIFIPASGGHGPGFRNGWRSPSDQNEWGYYWTSTLYLRENGNYANSFEFSSNGVSLTRTFLGEEESQCIQCFNGLTVRPVTK